jgi:hypothetical protein
VSDVLPLAAAQARNRRPGRPRKVAIALQPATPKIDARLLDRAASARYLGISVWSVIDLEAAGLLARVQIGALRRALYDKEDLDRLIEQWKDRS